MASRSKSINLLLRSVILPRAFQPYISTRSLLTNRVLQKELTTPLKTKTLSTNFFSPLPRRPTSKLLQLLQKRPYNQYHDNYAAMRQYYRIERNRKISNVILGLITAASVTIFAVKTIPIPESITSKYRQLRDIDMFLNENFAVSLRNAEMGRWWTYITSTFNHVSPMHLGLNMYALWSFGQSVAFITGPVGLVTLYVVGGLVCSMYTLKREKERNRGHGLEVSAVGASGSTCAISTALAVIQPRTTYGFAMIPFLSVPAWLMMGGFGAYSFLADQSNTQDGIGHAGHLGGMGAGLGLGLLFRIITRQF